MTPVPTQPIRVFAGLISGIFIEFVSKSEVVVSSGVGRRQSLRRLPAVRRPIKDLADQHGLAQPFRAGKLGQQLLGQGGSRIVHRGLLGFGRLVIRYGRFQAPQLAARSVTSLVSMSLATCSLRRELSGLRAGGSDFADRGCDGGIVGCSGGRDD
jgi:hypothetical protein